MTTDDHARPWLDTERPDGEPGATAPTPRPAFSGAPGADGDGLSRVEEAHRRGFAEGEAAARAALAAEVEALSTSLQQRTAELSAGYEAWRRELRDEMLHAVSRLALVAAERIVRDRIDDGDPIARRVLRELLGALGELPALGIRAHPEDIRELQASGDERLAEVQWHPDPTLARGGMLIDTGRGVVDATVEAALSALGDAVDGAE